METIEDLYRIMFKNGENLLLLSLTLQTVASGWFANNAAKPGGPCNVTQQENDLCNH